MRIRVEVFRFSMGGFLIKIKHGNIISYPLALDIFAKDLEGIFS